MDNTKGFSLTTTGILIAVAGPVLLHFGFSQQCSNEVVQVVPALIGGVIAQIGRWRAGGITPLGFKKPGY